MAQFSIGICCMHAKSQSAPMQAILTRFAQYQEFELVYFTEEMILNHSIETWPIVDCLITFFSSGLPLDKVIAFKHKYPRMFCVNDPSSQLCLRNRYKVYSILKSNNIPTVRYVLADRSKGIDPDLIEEDDYIILNGERIDKPFVEKPIDGEDHNINIYYPLRMGGGSTHLFRKIGNKSSERFPNESRVRRNGSFLYEEFIDTQNSQDIKMYAVGLNYVHAESRKSPVVDGVVLRDENGREIRIPVVLTDWEKEISRRVVLAFNQGVCGFDLLRGDGNRSFVCDVNGWSFVKGYTNYYDNCAKELYHIFVNAMKWKGAPSILFSRSNSIVPSKKIVSSLILIGSAEALPLQRLSITVTDKSMQETLQNAFHLTLDPLILNLQDPRHHLHLSNMINIAHKFSQTNFEQTFWVVLLELINHSISNTHISLWKQADHSIILLVSWGGTCSYYEHKQSKHLVHFLQKEHLLLLKPSKFVSINPSDPIVDSIAKTFVSEYSPNLQLTPFQHTSSIQPQSLPPHHKPLSENDLKHLQTISDYIKRLAMNPSISGILFGNETPLLFSQRWSILYSEFSAKDPTYQLSLLPRILSMVKYDILHNQLVLYRYHLYELYNTTHSLILHFSEVLRDLRNQPLSLDALKHISHSFTPSNFSPGTIEFNFCSLPLFVDIIGILFQNDVKLQTGLNQVISALGQFTFNSFAHLAFHVFQDANSHFTEIELCTGESRNIFGRLAKDNEQLDFQSYITLHNKMPLSSLVTLLQENPNSK